MFKKLKFPLRIRFLVIALSRAITTTVLGLSAYPTDTDTYQGTFRTVLGDELGFFPKAKMHRVIHVYLRPIIMTGAFLIHSKQPIDDVSDGCCVGTSLCDFDSEKWVNPRAIQKPLTDMSDLLGGIFDRFSGFPERVISKKPGGV